MPIAILFLIVAAAGLVAYLYPALRWPALGLVVFVGVVLAIFLLNSAPSESELRTQRIAPDDIALADLDLADNGRAARLTGLVENLSTDWRLRQFDLRLTLFDCPTAETATAECATIAEDTSAARVDVPPGQRRRFETAFGFRDRPAVQGVLIWRHAITGTNATP